MDSKFKWLQFFADGAPAGGDAGGEGAASGVQTAAAGRTLEELGVPSEKAERFRKARGNRMPPAAIPTEETPPAEIEPGAQQAEEPENTAIGWDAFMARPENKERLQNMMAERGRRATEEKNAAAAQIAKLNPMLSLIADHYGVRANEDGSLDLEALSRAVMDDDRYYEKYAGEMGVSADVGKRMAQLEREKAAAEAARQKAERDEQLRSYFYGVARQGEEMKKLYPDFNLEQEMSNPDFFRMVDPNGGRMSVKQAFWAVHGDELAEKQAEAVAQRAKLDVANAVRANQMRPRENGGSSAAVRSAPDIHRMDKAERLAYIKNKYPPR